MTVPTDTAETMQLAGHLALLQSVITSSVDGRPDERALNAAADLAERTGEGNAYGLWFGPFSVDLFRMDSLLEVGDYQSVADVAQGVDPRGHAPLRQAYFWSHYGRALARVRGRRDDAVRALRRAETISPRLIQRDQSARDVLAELLTHAKRDAAGRELRGMAYRAGLPV